MRARSQARSQGRRRRRALRSRVDSCQALASTAAQLQGLPPRDFLERLAEQVAGIRPGLLGAVDLMLGGRNALTGDGWSEPYADGSRGQARHFVGVAAARARWGTPFTRWVSVHVRRDAPGSPDGRLTEAALQFADGVLGGELPVPEAAAWIRTRLCGAVAGCAGWTLAPGDG